MLKGTNTRSVVNNFLFDTDIVPGSFPLNNIPEYPEVTKLNWLRMWDFLWNNVKTSKSSASSWSHQDGTREQKPVEEMSFMNLDI